MVFIGTLVMKFEKLNKHIRKNIYSGFPMVKCLKSHGVTSFKDVRRYNKLLYDLWSIFIQSV